MGLYMRLNYCVLARKAGKHTSALIPLTSAGAPASIAVTPGKVHGSSSVTKRETELYYICVAFGDVPKALRLSHAAAVHVRTCMPTHTRSKPAWIGQG